MNYLEFLRNLHTRLKPQFYFEIGCRKGASLTLSKAKLSVGVDPHFNITNPLLKPTRLFKMTSDEFFKNRATRVLGRHKVDFAFIDGMHLSEFALRDFLNVEKYLNAGAVVVLDDIMPNDIAMASRTREMPAWTGDIYKIHDVLKTYRPDLRIDVVDVDMKGAMVIRNFDPANKVLSENLSKIEAALVQVDRPVVSVADLRATMLPVDPVVFLDSLQPLAKAGKKHQ